MEDQKGQGVEEFTAKVDSGEVTLGGGAQFSVYISPQNETALWVAHWSVEFQQIGGNWSGTITSTNPTQILQTPNLSGDFSVKVMASVVNPTQPIEVPLHELQPQPGVQPGIIGCNSNCASFVGIVAEADHSDAQYWTTWDAICSQNSG